MQRYRFLLLISILGVLVLLGYFGLQWSPSDPGPSEISAAKQEPAGSSLTTPSLATGGKPAAPATIDPLSSAPLPAITVPDLLEPFTYKPSPVAEPSLLDLQAAPGAKGEPDTDPEVWPKPTPKPGTGGHQVTDEYVWTQTIPRTEAGEAIVQENQGFSERHTPSGAGLAPDGETDGPATYNWHDGDRILTVELQPHLVARSAGTDSLDDDAVVIAGEDIIIFKTGDSHSTDKPVFRSGADGSLMTLPGGVLLVLDPSWAEEEIAEFFVDNGIDANSVSSIDVLENAYFIETEPGLSSLDLANDLAVLSGVEISSPNWWQERTKR